MANSETSDVQVSIIVPMYKASKFVDCLMGSVLNQTFTNFELICVNDGSPDNTYELLQNWANKDNRIVLINKHKNGGASSARNAGLEVAKGELIWFHDCDDYAYPDTLSTMVHEIGSRDFLISDFINTKKPCRATSKMGESRNSRVSVRYIANNLNEMCTNQPFATWIGSLWRCLFKKSIMDRYNVRFRELGHEDSLFIYEYLHHCSSCIRIDFQGYVYKSTPGSLGSTHANNVNFEWCELAAKAARDCFSRFKITPDQVWYANMHRLYAVNCASFLTTGYHKDCSCPYSERIHRWRKMRHDDFWMECGRYGFITKLQEAIWHICKYRLFYIFDPLLLIATRLHDRH